MPPFLQGHERGKRAVDQDTDPHQVQAGGDLFEELRLGRQCHVALAGGDEFRPHGGVGRWDQLHVEPFGRVGADLLGDQHGGMVWVCEPVEDDAQVVGGLGGRERDQKKEKASTGLKKEAKDFCLRCRR